MMGPVVHIVYNLIRGGTEGQCARVAMGLRQRGQGHRVAVFQKRGFFVPRVEETCGALYELPIRRVLSWATWAEVVRFARWLKREKVMLVHAWDADSAIFGSLAARLAGIPYITSRRDMGAIYAPWKRRWMTWADKGARAVVVNAAAIRTTLEAAGYSGSQLELVPNLFDVAEFDRLARLPFSRAEQLPSGRLLTMVARLDPEKDAPTLIRAFGLLADRFPDLSLVIAGDGPDRKRCEEAARKIRGGGRVIFLGEIEDVPALLTRATIGALVPASNEGQSNSILEYFAARLPVVATDCGGNRELVESAGAGYVVPVGSAERTAAACAELLGDPSAMQRMGEAGRRKIETDHSPETILNRFEALYRRCLES